MPHVKRHFCGFCGTPLSSWNESSHEEADWICVNVGSLRNESIARLEQSLEDDDPNQEPQTSQTVPKTSSNSSLRDIMGNPWFEETIESNELGRIKRRRGGHTSADGKSKIEWEVVEVGDDEDESSSPTAKRVNAVRDDEGNDIQMGAAQ